MRLIKSPDSNVQRGFLFNVVFVIYQLGWCLGIPIALIRLCWRSRQEPGYRAHMLERLGFYPHKFVGGTPIWIHAVSVGETRAATFLIESLLKQNKKILLTHMTPTGRRTGADIFKQAIAQGQLIQAYLPYDFIWSVKRFLNYFSPKLGMMMETEAWPTLVMVTKNQHMPLFLINGRLSERSARRIERFGRLGRVLFQSFQQIFAQTIQDQHRYESLGVQHCLVTGNLKFDIQLNEQLLKQGQAWKSAALSTRTVICAASTREGEEALIVQAWKKIDQTQSPLLMIIPRHPQRFEEVEKIIQAQGLSLQRRSHLSVNQKIDAQVLLGDSMGEMALYYAMSDYVVMGGSLLPFGGQNLIEPCSIGKPVILGLHTFNFSKASQDALALGAGWRLSKAVAPDEIIQELVNQINHLLDNPQEIATASQGAFQFTRTHQGATQRTLENLQDYL